jgi:23S rRNA (uracil1939-C5)-methyltransferase
VKTFKSAHEHHMLRPGQTIGLTAEKPAAGGRMIARVDGQVVLVGGAIPGERVQARIDRVGKGVAFAETVGVDEPSADRRAEFADPSCGGCTYSHIAYPRQLEIKGQVIADAFARIGRLTLPSVVTVKASPERGYRMRARLHVRGGRFGFFREGTHDLCDARATHQLLPATSDALERVVSGIQSSGTDTVHGLELSENVTADQRVVHLDTSRPPDARLLEIVRSTPGLTPPPFVTDTLTIGDATFALRRHALSFFQGNRFLLSDLVAHVVERVPIGSAVADLYAGAGLFAVSAAVVRGAYVIAVEGDRIAAEDLHANAAAAGGQLTTAHQPVENFAAWFPRVMNKLPGGLAIETVVVDPPRTGVSREALDGVLTLRAGRIVYVSCDVATLARDARRLVDAGYTIARADAFDLFPNTPHVETVVVFENVRM